MTGRAMVIEKPYAPADKARVVGMAVTLGVRRTAAETGVPRTTLIAWVKSPEFAAVREEANAEMLSEVGAAARKALERLIEKLDDPDASLKDVATAYGILTDKYTLLSGGATSRHEVVTHARSTGTDDLPAGYVEELRAFLGSVIPQPIQLDAGEIEAGEIEP